MKLDYLSKGQFYGHLKLISQLCHFALDLKFKYFKMTDKNPIRINYRNIDVRSQPTSRSDYFFFQRPFQNWESIGSPSLQCKENCLKLL